MHDSMFDMVRSDLVNKDKSFKYLPDNVKDKIAQRYVDQLLNADVRKPLSAAEADRFHSLLVEEFGEKNLLKLWFNKLIRKK